MRFSFFFPKPNGATRTRFECILMHLVPFLDVSGGKTFFEEKYFSEISGPRTRIWVARFRPGQPKIGGQIRHMCGLL